MKAVEQVLAEYDRRWEYLDRMSPEAVVELARKGSQAADYLAWSDRVHAAGLADGTTCGCPLYPEHVERRVAALQPLVINGVPYAYDADRDSCRDQRGASSTADNETAPTTGQTAGKDPSNKAEGEKQ